MEDFDRAAMARRRTDEIARLYEDGAALLVPLWRNKALTAGSEAAYPRRDEAGDLVELAEQTVFLGTSGGRGVFALDLPGAMSAKELAAGRGHFNDLRMVGGGLSRVDVEVLLFARGMLYWHRHNRFCPACGGETAVEEAGHVRLCRPCDRRHFPRTDPAIMALVIHQDRCLLARQPSWPEGMLSVLAGFVEPGESIEQAVAREVREEVGLAATAVDYLGSQPWPFPASLMIGFSVLVDDAGFKLEDEELEAARWLTRDELRAQDGFFIPPPFSLAHKLITAFVEGKTAGLP